MCKFNVYDVVEIQESLESYLKLLGWLPSIDEEEEAMRQSRIRYTKHLIEKCEQVINGEKIWENTYE